MGKTTSSRAVDLILAAGAGALLMYLLDPQQGRRRVARVRDTAVHWTHKGSDFADAGVRDLSHRATGVVAGLRGALRGGRPSDAVLVERIRSTLGRWTSHPRAIQVSAADGHVTVSGAVLRSEQARLLREIHAVRGVRRVESRLEVHDSPAHVPALQGGSARTGPRMELMQKNWSVGPRLLSALGGTALALYGAGRRTLGGTMLAMAGAGLAARAATNRELRQALGMSGEGAVEIEKTLHIAAPPEAVFAMWCDYENFPCFMSHVEDVRALDETRSHWVVKGPAGTKLEWDAVLTERVAPHVLAWHTDAGAPVRHAGRVRFEPAGQGTRVTVHMSYRPPGGVVGHTVARLLGRDPKHEMDADLMRMKHFVERGRPPHDAARPDGGAAMPVPAERVNALH